ncbi:MAG: radical SAM protein [Promethearchaeota archaeon]
MTTEIKYVDKNSNIPLYGVDFIGVIDRGTNIIEVKPLTICNLKCKYCFVSAGDYETNFIVDPLFLVEKVNEICEIKGRYDIEIHIAPYGESLLYSGIYLLIKELWEINGIKTISMQSNGLLLNENAIKKLEKFKLTRINISLNTLSEEKANYLCNCKNYNIEIFLNNIYFLLDSNINVLLAPVWFPGENDSDIEDIIQFVVELRKKGYSEKKIQIGIQKYLIYKTGRKLKKIKPKTWNYFYNQLSKLEKKYKIKLKLGPKDFGIQKRKGAVNLNLKKNDLIKLKIISKGRWNRECIGKITENLGIKVLLKKQIAFSDKLIGKEILAKIIKANYKDNIITAIFPF